MVAALLALLAFAGHAGAATLTGGTGTDPWISSELPDYTAGSTVNLLGGSWQPGEAVHISVNDSDGQTWAFDDDVTADGSGDIADSFTLPSWFVANYSVTATGASGSVATSAFTDAISTTTSVTSNNNPSTQGQSVTFTATVKYGATGGGHTVGDPVTVGTVKIGYGSNCNGGFTQIGSSGTPNASGQLSVTTSALTAAGSPYAIYGCYQGTGGSTGTGGSDNNGLLSQTVNGATASVSGAVYQDSNGNGSQDAGEPGISGVGVSLSGASSASTTTNGSGVYTFSGLGAGNYGVDYTVPTGYANTGTKPFSTFAVAAGQAVTGKDFFARKQSSTNVARTAGVSPSTYGDSVTFTATVTSGAGNPSSEGTVQFKDGANAIAGCGAVALGGNTASCTVSKLSVAGSPHGITAVYSGTTSGNGFAGSTSGSVSQSLTAKGLTVSGITAANKVYDGLLGATVNTSAAALNGVVSGDSVALNAGGTSGAFASKNVGTGKSVQVSGLTISGADAGNYSLAQPTTTADITAKNLTIGGASANNKTYDGNASATIDWTSAALNGVVSGDDVTIDHSGYSASFDDKNVGSAKPVTVSGVGLGGSDASNYTVSQPSGLAARITARDLTVTASGQNKVYDGTTDATVSLSSDKLGGDSVTLDYTAASFGDKNAGTTKAVSVSGISISGADAGNYHLTSSTASTTADIAARAITVTAKSDSKVYDGDNSSSRTPDVTSGSIAAGDTPSFGQHFDDKNVATGKTLTATGSVADGNSGGNYDVSFVDDTTGVISARGLTVSAHGVNKVYDGTRDATVTLSSDKVAGDELTPGYASASFADKNAGTSKAVGVSGISISGADAGNYDLLNTTDSTTADITARDLTVTAHGVNKVYDGTTVATVTLSSDKLSGDAVTLDYAAAAFGNKNVGTGKAVTASGISTSGADAGNYHLTGTTAGTTADITARGLTVGAAGVNKVYDGTVAATVGLSSDKVAGDSLTLGYGSAAFGDRNVGAAKPVGVSGISVSGADAGNYSLLNTTASTTADITVRPITVTAVTDTKTYDGTTGSNATPAVSSGSIAVGDVPDFSETFATKTVGSGKTLVPAGSVLDHNGGGNYAVTFVSNTTGVIVPKTLLVTGITAAGKPWDGNTAATLDTSGATLNGVVSPDAVTLGLGGASGAFSSSAVGTWTVQIAGLTLSGADAGNYNLMQPTATASIAAWNASGKGFYAPVGVSNSLFVPAPAALPAASTSTIWNTVKGGQTVPLKFNVYAGAVERTALTDIASFTQASVACTGGDGSDPVDITTTGNTSLRYDTTAMQWVQNWKTPSYSASASCYRATVRFADGSALSAFFRLTK
jgi:hypothetical protein